MKIGFIGPGKVGVSLGRYFTHKGIELSGFYGLNIDTAKEAAEITKSKFYNNIEDIIKESDILFITTPDDTISIIDKELSKFDLINKSVCHASGSLKSNVLYNAQKSGALIYSIHPMFAFSNKKTNLKELENIYFSVEGENLNQSTLDEKIHESGFPSVIDLIKILGNKYFIRGEETSSIYHLANVFVSNLTLSLLDIGTNYLKKLGLTEAEALNAIKPLVQGNIDSICSKGFVNSLTGPVLRGDVTTINKHISVLDNEDIELYKILSLNLLKLVSQRNSEESNLNRGNKGIFNDKNVIDNFISKSEKHLEIYKILGGLN